MIIDCMDWHYRDNYPEGLDKVHAATHIGIFIAWIIENNLESEILRKNSYNYIIPQQIKNPFIKNLL